MGCLASRPVDEFHITTEGGEQGNKYCNGSSGRTDILGVQVEGQSFTMSAPNTCPNTPTRTSHMSSKQHRHSYIAADLNAIVDDQGTISPLVSRQLSMMSRYSVKSDGGSVICQQEHQSKHFRLIKLIGRGGFGNVYLGDWQEMPLQRCAIKIISGNNNGGGEQDDMEWEAKKEKMAQMESILMSAVKNHPYIVSTFRVYSNQGPAVDPELVAVEKSLLQDGDFAMPSFEWHIVMEYCDKGSLSRALATHRFHELGDAGMCRWDAWAALETLKEVTQAIMFLHENDILHGDLKAANVLLQSSDQDRRGFVSKVSDFGLSRVLKKSKNHIKTQTFGTVTHMPPELLSKGILNHTADVYAIGVLMWEVYSGDRVFKQLSDSEVILAVVTRKLRPAYAPDCPSRYRYLSERCWSDLAEVRPSLQQLYNELDNLQQQLCPQGPDTPKLNVTSMVKQQPRRSGAGLQPMPLAKPQAQSRLANGTSNHAISGNVASESNMASSPHAPASPAAQSPSSTYLSIGHRPAKSAVLPKSQSFAPLALAREPSSPRHGSGHVQFALPSNTGNESDMVQRSNGSLTLPNNVPQSLSRSFVARDGASALMRELVTRNMSEAGMRRPSEVVMQS